MSAGTYYDTDCCSQGANVLFIENSPLRSGFEFVNALGLVVLLKAHSITKRPLQLHSSFEE